MSILYMANLKTSYWKFFNAAARVVGAGFCLVGAIVGISGAASRDPLAGVMGLVVVVLGLLLLSARPYRPDLPLESDKEGK
jgi:hypothetical protein